nr:wall-associated receptor kinase-like 20 [Ipomoea trifida]
MKLLNSFSAALILLALLPSPTSSQICPKTCGPMTLKYPFGTAPGCGDPRFQPYVTCTNNQQLTFATHTGCYPVTAIDYNHHSIFISDPTLSTCSCTQPSRGFSLDSNAPFAFRDDTIFALLGCSADASSPIYKSAGGANSSFPMCDSQGAPVCSILYSCEAMSRLNLPVSTCCVYTPVDLGPAFEMDLQKLQCASYSAMYGFNGGGEEGNNPQAWKYGIALKYKFNFNNDFPELCASCERSNGVCGYSGPYKSFSCNCPSGFNTTTDCFLGNWSGSFRVLPWRNTGFLLVEILVLFILFALM